MLQSVPHEVPYFSLASVSRSRVWHDQVGPLIDRYHLLDGTQCRIFCYTGCTDALELQHLSIHSSIIHFEPFDSSSSVLVGSTVWVDNFYYVSLFLILSVVRYSEAK